MQLHHALRLAPDELSVVTLVGAGGKTSALFRLAEEAVGGGRRVVTTTTTHIFAAQAEQAPARLEVTPDRPDAVDWAALEAQLARHGHCLIWSQPGVRSAGAGGGSTNPTLTGSKRQGLPPLVVDALAARAGDLGISLIAIEGDGSRRRPVKAPASHEPVIPDCTTHLVPVAGLDGLGLPLDEPYMHRPERVRALLQEEDVSTRLTPRMLGRLLVEPYGGGERGEERGEREPRSGARPAGARLVPLLNKAESAPRLAAARLIAQQLVRQSQAALIGTVGTGSRTAVRERWGATTAVVLAAGKSRRMGEPKQLLRWQGEPLVTRAARIALESGASETVVITGAVGEQVEAALAPLREMGRGRLRVVHNPAWQDGQAGSVRAAVEALPAACEAVLFLPVDQPRLPAGLLRRLWQAWRGGSDLGAVTVDGAIRGAPGLFDRRFFGQLRQVQGDGGGGRLLRRYAAEVSAIEAPVEWVADVDTPEDWRAAVDRG
ncbi:MAG: selenium cofactor biosynthesis protein YqeC [Caldilineaceae bacterium]|nr:selenium cofactor biosynthesis protein YqeC [Caldilineaceae bacterium]